MDFLTGVCVVRKINVGKSVNGSSDAKEGNSTNLPQPNGPQQESKLELFGFDSLVNILGLKRYGPCWLYCESLFLFCSWMLPFLSLQINAVTFVLCSNSALMT